MRRITFNEETINQIREYSIEHSLMETCNRFTLKPDTLKRVARENNITFKAKRIVSTKDVSDDIVNTICNLYSATNMDVASIRKEVGIGYNTVKTIIAEHFTEEYQNNRKSKLYRLSKLGNNNPMLGKTGDNHPNYKGIISDGKGYLMCLKPDWYTGRKGSNHVFVHTVVMCEALGLTELPKGFIVHHIDGNKHNNNITNLALITNSGHSKLHGILRNSWKVQRLSDNGVAINDSETLDND